MARAELVSTDRLVVIPGLAAPDAIPSDIDRLWGPRVLEASVIVLTVAAFVTPAVSHASPVMASIAS